MSHDGMIAVIAAHKEGKVIQCRLKGGKLDAWGTTKDPWWDFNQFDYRVKPEPRKPRVIWVNEYPNGELDFAHESENQANECARISRVRCFKAIEVI